MKLLLLKSIKDLNQLISTYMVIFNQFIIESEQAHYKMIEDSGWTLQEYMNALNNSRADLHKYF